MTARERRRAAAYSVLLVAVLGLLVLAERVFRPPLDPAAFVEIAAALRAMDRDEIRAPSAVDVFAMPHMEERTGRRARLSLTTGPGWSLEIKGWTRVSGHVFSVDPFHDDVVKALSPYDLAIGWQAAAQPSAVERITARHYRRYAHFRGFRETEVQSLTNMHLIPGSPEIHAAMGRVSPGHRVAIVGYPVRVRSPRLFSAWDSDMVYGDRNCEIVVVTGLRIETDEGRLVTMADLASSPS